MGASPLRRQNKARYRRALRGPTEQNHQTNRPAERPPTKAGKPATGGPSAARPNKTTKPIGRQSGLLQKLESPLQEGPPRPDRTKPPNHSAGGAASYKSWKARYRRALRGPTEQNHQTNRPAERPPTERRENPLQEGPPRLTHY
jgi:hypothetical protein